MMANDAFDDIKKGISVAAGVLTIYVVFVSFIKTVHLKALGASPPRSLFWQNLPWFISEGPIGSNAFARMIINYFEKTNQKSF